MVSVQSKQIYRVGMDCFFHSDPWVADDGCANYHLDLEEKNQGRRPEFNRVNLNLKKQIFFNIFR